MLVIVKETKTSLIRSLKQIQPAAAAAPTAAAAAAAAGDDGDGISAAVAADDNMSSSQSVAAYHDEDQGSAAAAAPVSRETSHPPGVADASTAASHEVLLNRCICLSRFSVLTATNNARLIRFCCETVMIG